MLRCFQAGALATGSELSIVGGEKPYTEMQHDGEIAGLYRRNAESLGRKFVELDPVARQRTAASTDMGNVSQAIPSIHPMIGLTVVSRSKPSAGIRRPLRDASC